MGRKGIAKRMLEYKANMCDPYCVNYYVNDKDTNIGHDHTIGVAADSFSEATGSWSPNSKQRQLTYFLMVTGPSFARNAGSASSATVD